VKPLDLDRLRLLDLDDQSGRIEDFTRSVDHYGTGGLVLLVGNARPQSRAALDQHLGETAGALTGAALTRIDSLLQRQTLVRGYSTKIAVFQRK